MCEMVITAEGDCGILYLEMPLTAAFRPPAPDIAPALALVCRYLC